MKEFLEGLEIGEGKVKLSAEEIKSILTEHGKSITTETDKVKKTLNDSITDYQNQLKTANDTIKSYKDMDIDGIKKSASEWETKYNELVEKEKRDKEESIRNERVNDFFKDIKFSSEMAKAGVIAEFNKKEFKYDEESKSFQGATEWLNGLKESDKGSFLSDVANPKFTTIPQSPTNTSTNDELRKAMGLAKEEKK